MTVAEYLGIQPRYSDGTNIGGAVCYPRAVCPHCFGGPLSWFAAAGTGTVYSYTVVHRAFGEFARQIPFTVALVDLDEGSA